jgi:hypothetical protein
MVDIGFLPFSKTQSTLNPVELLTKPYPDWSYQIPTKLQLFRDLQSPNLILTYPYKYHTE